MQKSLIGKIILIFVINLFFGIEVIHAALLGPSGPDCYLANELEATNNNFSAVVDAINPPLYDYTKMVDKDIVGADGTVSVVSSPTIIPASDPVPPWVIMSGLEVKKGERLKIFTQGEIDLCGNTQADDIDVPANNNGWIDTQMSAQISGDLVITFTGGSVVDPESGSTDPNSTGKGLYVYIGGNTAPNIDPSAAGTMGSQFFQLYQPIQVPDPNDPTKTVTAYNNIFNGKPTASGRIWLRYKDADTTGGWGKTYANNTGQYSVKIITPCRFENGQYLMGYIGDRDPNNPRIDPMNQDQEGLKYIGLDFFDPPGKAWADGNVWFTIMDKADQYADNSGAYRVLASLEMQTSSGFFADFTKKIVTPIKALMAKISSSMFNKVIANPIFQNGVRLTVTIYMIVTFIFFMTGMIQMTQFEFVIRIAKISMLLGMVSPIFAGGSTPWQFFYDNVFRMFLEGMTYVINVMISLYNPTTIISNQEVDFSFLDYTVNVIFSKVTMIRLWAIFVTGIMGIATFIVAVVALVFLMVAFIKAVIIYVMAQITIALLIIVAPIFFVFILFGMTKQLFDGWLKLMVNYVLQPILVFTIIVLFSYWIMSAIRYALGFSICKKCVLGFGIPEVISNAMSLPPLQICLFEFYQPWGYDNSTHVLGSLFSGIESSSLSHLLFPALILLILATSLSGFIDFAVQLSNALTNLMSSSLAGAAGGAMGGVVSPIKSAIEGVADLAIEKGKDMYEERKTDALQKQVDAMDDGKSVAGADGNKMEQADVSRGIDAFANHRDQELPAPASEPGKIPGRYRQDSGEEQKPLPAPVSEPVKIPGRYRQDSGEEQKPLPAPASEPGKIPGRYRQDSGEEQKPLPPIPTSNTDKHEGNSFTKAFKKISSKLDEVSKKISDKKDAVEDTLNRNIIKPIDDKISGAKDNIERKLDSVEKKITDLKDGVEEKLSFAKSEVDHRLGISSKLSDIQKSVDTNLTNASNTLSEAKTAIGDKKDQLIDDFRRNLNSALDNIDKKASAISEKIEDKAYSKVIDPAKKELSQAYNKAKTLYEDASIDFKDKLESADFNLKEKVRNVGKSVDKLGKKLK